MYRRGIRESAKYAVANGQNIGNSTCDRWVSVFLWRRTPCQPLNPAVFRLYTDTPNFLSRDEGLGIFEAAKTVNSKSVFMSLKGSAMDKIISAAELSGWVCTKRMH